MSQTRRTALVLTSSGALREVIAEFLLASDVPVDEILCASRDAEALYFLRSRPIDILITDHTPAWELTPATLVIGPPAVAKIQRSLEAGATGYLVKPFSQESLVREVGYALQAAAV